MYDFYVTFNQQLNWIDYMSKCHELWEGLKASQLTQLGVLTVGSAKFVKLFISRWYSRHIISHCID